MSKYRFNDGTIITADTKEEAKEVYALLVSGNNEVTAGIFSGLMSKLKKLSSKILVKLLKRAMKNEKGKENILKACDFLVKKFPKYANAVRKFKSDFKNNKISEEGVTASVREVDAGLQDPITMLCNLFSKNTKPADLAGAWASFLVHGFVSLPIGAIVVLKFLIETGRI